MLTNVIIRAGVMLIGVLLACYAVEHVMLQGMEAVVSPLTGALQ